MTRSPRVFEVTDDSGFLGVVDPAAYATYVDEDWTLEQLFAHFEAHMGERALLLWGTGMECDWQVEIADAGSTPPPGFRRTAGPIRVTAGRLLLVNYEDLTSAAQDVGVTLPEPHCADLLVEVPSGDYTCEITQLNDPDSIGDDEDDSRERTDFVLTLKPGSNSPPWRTPEWFETTW